MPNTVRYEWTIEVKDLYGDIEHSDFADTYIQLPVWLTQGDRAIDTGLVRNEGNEVAGIVSRHWAYIGKDGKLPEYFSDENGNVTGYRVPKKYHKELL